MKNKPIKSIISTIKKSDYGITPEGQFVDLYKLTNTNGIEVDIITYGGIITSLKVPNKNGKIENIVLGFDSLEAYLNDNFYLGALIGRFANRISNGKFTLNQTEYEVAKNIEMHHLHGGDKGFDKVVWKAKPIIENDSVSLKLTYFSRDMEEGYPGNLTTTVTYTLTNNNELKVFYEATTDKITIVNYTQHSYFNLSGDLSKQILDHELIINADTFLPVDEKAIPTGMFKSVVDTPFDFRTAKAIGKDIHANNEQLMIGNGYDHNWVLNNQNKSSRFVASAFHSESGRFLEVFSDQPGIQLYSGNSVNNDLVLKKGINYIQYSGFCFETQHYPDTPNQKNFPTVMLKPGETFKSSTVFRFSVK